MFRLLSGPLILLLLSASLLVGCMSGASSGSAYLLEKDYLRMTDSEIILYERQLSDELVKANRSGSRDVNVGIGLGSWGGDSGIGLHADKWFGGGESQVVADLKLRRSEVREEMRRRGLLPE